MADYVGGDMIRGHIDTIILNSLIDGDKDTNQIRAEIEARAGGQFQLKQGTFYSALQRIVKQGYVIEYRTTGPDGVRRKYFQLTEKGKDLIDKNQSSWTFSRQVINTLLDTSQTNATNAKAPVPTEEEDVIPDFNTPEIPNFSNLQNGIDVEEKTVAEQVISSIDDSEIEDEVVESTDDLSDLTETTELAVFTEETPPIFNPEEDKSTPETFDEIMNMLETIDKQTREEEDNKIREEEQRLERERILAEEKAKAEEEERIIRAQVEKQRLEREKNIIDIEIPDEFKIAEERSKNPVPLHDEPTPPVIPDYIKNSLAESENQTDAVMEEDDTPIIIPVEPQIEAINEPDDFLNANELPVQKEYKTVLERIFANDSKQTMEQTIETAPPSEKAPLINDDEGSESDQFDRIVDELDLSTPSDSNTTSSFDPSLKPSKSKKNGSFDYSDIIALSQKEGFKINTADKTNKNELGKILINRLNFHTSIIFFILIAFEILLIGFSMEKLLQYGIEPYIYFAFAILAFPIISGMVYYMAPKRTIAEVTSFKSAFETALIITLNLILMILVYAVVIDLDFTSHFAIARNLFVPLMMVINVPIFVIIRYSLLEKQMYFS